MGILLGVVGYLAVVGCAIWVHHRIRGCKCGLCSPIIH